MLVIFSFTNWKLYCSNYYKNVVFLKRKQKPSNLFNVKNNEFNFVKVSNEGKNPNYEYGKAQDVEYSFQPENKNPVKDELNDNSVVNDKVEDNLLKTTKEQEEKKQEAEQVESSSSSTSAPSASSASSSASAASSSAASSAAASSSIGATIATVAVAAVVAVGGAAGISILHEEVAKEELVVFTSSEITSNSVDFSFRMSSNLLLPNENNEEDVEVESEKNVVYLIENSDGFKVENYLVEYVEVDENTFEYAASIKDLLPNTSYALTLYVKEESPSFEQPNYLELATRNFTTKPSGEEPVAILLDRIEVSNPQTEFNVGDEFVFGGTVVAIYSDSSSKEVTDVNFSGYDLSKGGNQTVTVSYSEGDISQSTSYEIVVAKPDVTFSTIDAGYDYVHFEVLIDKEAAEYDPTRSAPIQFCLSGPDGFYDQCWAEEVVEYGDDLFARGDFSGLEKDTEYTLTVKVSLEQELKTLGETTVKTKSSEFKFQLVRPEDGGVTFTFSILKNYIGYVEGETSPDVVACVSSEGEIIADAQVTISSYDSKYALGTGFVADLPNGKTLNLEIHYYETPSSDGEILGSKEFTTEEGLPTFEFAGLDYFYIGDDYISPMFYIDTAEVERPATGDESNIYMSISGGLGYSQIVCIPYSTFQSSQDGRLFARYAFEGLSSNIEYTIEVRNENTGETYGSIAVSTTGPETGFELKETSISYDNIEAVYYLDISYAASMESITAVVATPDGQIVSTANAEHRSDSTETGKSQYYVKVEGIEPSTNYIMGFYCDDGNKNNLVSTYSFTSGESQSGFAIDFVSTTSGSANITFTIKREYVDYDTDPTEAQRKLTAQVEPVDGGNTIEASCTSLDISSETHLTGVYEITGLEYETEYYFMPFYDGSTLLTTARKFSTDSINFKFNGVNFVEETSFEAHQIELKLDFEDDPFNPQFQNLSIQFYSSYYEDSEKQYLGSIISLESTTSYQTIEIIGFDLGDIKSYDILATQVEIEGAGGNVTFTNSDQHSYPEVDLSGNSWLGTRSAADGSFVMPVQLAFEDPGKTCEEGFIIRINGSYSASLDWTTEYQYAVFDGFASEFDPSQTYDITISPTIAAEEIIGSEDQVSIQSADINMVYSAKLSEESKDKQLSQQDTSIDLLLVYLYGDHDSNFTVILDGGATQYTYTLILPQTPSNSEYTMNLIDGTTITDYQTLQSQFEDVEFNIYIQFNNGSAQQLTIAEGVTFTFA